ncbi:MAG: hypothetical protein PHF86_11735 [Candidatus Nanoarchaeia archaeon]|nr:hypothetical protein [Candidatus Nanoarchaeia archaeon]
MDIKKIVIDLSLGFLKDGLIGILKTVLEFVLLIAIGCFLVTSSIQHNKKLNDLKAGIDSIRIETEKLHRQIDSLRTKE